MFKISPCLYSRRGAYFWEEFASLENIPCDKKSTNSGQFLAVPTAKLRNNLNFSKAACSIISILKESPQSIHVFIYADGCIFEALINRRELVSAVEGLIFIRSLLSEFYGTV